MGVVENVERTLAEPEPYEDAKPCCGCGAWCGGPMEHRVYRQGSKGQRLPWCGRCDGINYEE